jgi:hypothetical protein
MPPHVLMDFAGFPPGHGSSLTYFWGWDAHEAQLRCTDDVSGDTGGWVPGGPLNINCYKYKCPHTVHNLTITISDNSYNESQQDALFLKFIW